MYIHRKSLKLGPQKSAHLGFKIVKNIINSHTGGNVSST